MRMDLGRTFEARASREVMTFTPSNSRSGIRRILQPVAIRMFFALKNFPLCSPCVMDTIPGALTCPEPTK